jgi:hypothetical protein
MHTDSLSIAKRMHAGEVPRSWLTGDTHYQKAAVIAAVAWSEVKPADDPQFVDADQTFRENCIAVVETVMRGGEPDNTPFAHKAAELWKQTAEYTDRHPNKETKLL